MVRSNELGCRNGWNADLWVPASTDGEKPQEQPLDPIGGRARKEVEPAEQTDLITSIVAAKTDNLALPEVRPSIAPIASSALEEDIFVKQTPSLSWSSGPISAQPATELVQNPKAAILRARDQYRQRRKNEGRLADRQFTPPAAPLISSSREALKVDEFDLVEPEPPPESVDPRYENRPLIRPSLPTYDERRPVSPVTLREIDRPFPSMTDFPEDRARFESVPNVEADAAGLDEDAFSFAAQDDTWIETRQIDTVPPEPYVVDELFDEEDALVAADGETYEEVELSVRHRESVLNRLLRHRRERRQTLDLYDEPFDVESAPISAEPLLEPIRYEVAPPEPAGAPEVHPRVERHEAYSNRMTPETSPDRTAARPERPAPAPRPRPETSRDARPAPEFDDDFVLPPPLPVYEPQASVAATSPARPRPRADTEKIERRPQPSSRPMETAPDEFGDQPLFASAPPPVDDYAIDPPYQSSAAQNMPAYRMERICQTCRDFRPADNGERGWCNNKWAFNHRRMVDADDLACRNSLGSWWTPKDDVWRRDGDISRHAQQTPRVDQWLFETQSEHEDRRRSGS